MIEKIEELKKENITADESLHDAGWNGAINEVLKTLKAGHGDTIAMPFDSETDAINWVWENMPMAVKPTNRSKKHWIHPYKSKHCRRQIANHIGEKLYDQSRSKLKLKH